MGLLIGINLEFETSKDRRCATDRDVDPGNLSYSGRTQSNRVARHRRRIDVDHTFEYTAAGNLLNEPGHAVSGSGLSPEISAALKPVGGLGIETQLSGCGPD